MAKIIYSKYSNERAERFSVRTDIVENDGKIIVEKRPVSEAARRHVEEMCDIFRELQPVCASCGYEMISCEKKEDGVIFPYVRGETLEEIWDALLAGGFVSRVEEELITYCGQVRSMFSDTSFCMTDSFRDVFGDVNLPAGMMARGVSNIDMLAGNIICSGDKRHLIDYEWTFFFPVPVDFIIYRILHYYLYANELRAVLRGLDLFSRCSIPASCMSTFETMERMFQKYITGTRVPLRELYPSISPGVFSAQGHAEKEAAYRRNCVLQLFYSYGSGYSEEGSMYFPMKDYRIRLKLDLPPGVTNIRLDPGASAVLCKVERLCFDISSSEIEPYHSIGCILQDNWIVFDQADPQLTLDDIPKEAGILFAELFVVPLEEDILRVWAEDCRCRRSQLEQCIRDRDEQKRKSDLLEEEKHTLEEEKRRLEEEKRRLEEEKHKLEEKNHMQEEEKRDLESEITNLQQQIRNMRLTKVWRAWEKAQKITGRGSKDETD